MRASARPSAGQTALLLSKAKIEDEEETGRAIAKKERKIRCTTRVPVSSRTAAHVSSAFEHSRTLPTLLHQTMRK
jgi:hypothetical protein